MVSREEMLAIFAGGNIPKSSEWQALINKLYDTAEGTGAIGDNLQQSEALAREVRENTAAVAEDVLAVEQAKNDIALIAQTITQLIQRAETAEQNSQTNLTESGKQTTLATQAATRAEQAANSVDSKVTELVAEGNSQVNRISTEAQLLINQLIETSEEQQGLLAEPLQLAGQYAETSFAHSKASGEARAATEGARDETQKAYEKTDAVKGAVLASQRKTEAARNETQQAQSQVERQIIPVHTDVIRTQQIIRSMANGVQADASDAADSAELAKNEVAKAAEAAADAQQTLNTIGTQLITYATNLIRTQSVVVTNYAFK